MVYYLPCAFITAKTVENHPLPAECGTNRENPRQCGKTARIAADWRSLFAVFGVKESSAHSIPVAISQKHCKSTLGLELLP